MVWRGREWCSDGAASRVSSQLRASHLLVAVECFQLRFIQVPSVTFVGVVGVSHKQCCATVCIVSPARILPQMWWHTCEWVRWFGTSV